jgi:hypothetical protein
MISFRSSLVAARLAPGIAVGLAALLAMAGV